LALAEPEDEGEGDFEDLPMATKGEALPVGEVSPEHLA
jgi:hypothetical protein